MALREEQRAALFEIVGLLAPDLEKAWARLADALARGGPEPITPEEALIEALYDEGSGLAYCGWEARPSEVRDYLEELPTFPPGLTWEWYKWTAQEAWDPEEDLYEFLWPLADRCLRLGVALVGVLVDGEGYTLGFLPADDLAKFVELAGVAHSTIYVHRTGAPTP
ncbi:DUF6630 family protein [Nocardia jejuensis]|uniref:DUF6630 family protein n=1 Tax=Nocardia jejuensis TaxID=328049 RepID=UPI000833ED17|nr:hypothetical protein [Nocardia jejuensis]